MLTGSAEVGLSVLCSSSVLAGSTVEGLWVFGCPSDVPRSLVGPRVLLLVLVPSGLVVVAGLGIVVGLATSWQFALCGQSQTSSSALNSRSPGQENLTTSP